MVLGIDSTPHNGTYVSDSDYSSHILSPWLGRYSRLRPRIAVYRRPAILHSTVGRYDNAMPESIISPSQGLRIWPLSLGDKLPAPAPSPSLNNTYFATYFLRWMRCNRLLLTQVGANFVVTVSAAQNSSRCQKIYLTREAPEQKKTPVSPSNFWAAKLSIAWLASRKQKIFYCANEKKIISPRRPQSRIMENYWTDF